MRYLVTLEAAGKGPPPGVRIKRLLKAALRVYGLRCTALREDVTVEFTRPPPALAKRRLKCRCAAYPWPHRPGGGLCRYPDPPLETWQGTSGKNVPTALRRCGYRKTLMRRYGLHPIRDREKIKRFLPRLYKATLKRWCPEVTIRVVVTGESGRNLS